MDGIWRLMGTELLTKVDSFSEIREWDAVDEEPDLDIHIRTRRTLDAKGQPCSEWAFAYAVEGVVGAEISQKQRDYAATAARQIARVIQDVNLQEYETLDSNLARLATMLRAEIKATMNMYVKLALHLVKRKGLPAAASILGLKEYKVRHLLRERGAHIAALENRA